MVANGCSSSEDNSPPPPGCLSAAQLPQHFEQFFIVRHLIERIHLGKYDFALLVDDEYGALTDSCQGRTLAENPEGSGHGPVGIKVGAHRDVHLPNVVLLPSHVAIKRIYTDVQNLGIELGELLAVAVERRYLLRSSRRPINRVKGYDHMLLVAIITESDPDPLVSFDGRQLKIRSHFSYFQSHAFSL